MRYDVLVCGAGPAGATAARELARQGAKVLLCEKEKLPRYKACGGGLTGKVWSELEPGWEDAVEEGALRVVFYHREEDPVEVAFDRPVVKLVMRDRFDQMLVEQAAAAGAEVWDGCRVEGVVEEEREVRVHTGQGVLPARVIIGADGARSLVARQLPFRPSRALGVALEAELPVSPLVLEQYRHRLLLSYGSIAGGYGWVFPKADHLSVGIGSFGRQVKGLRTLFQQFCHRLGLPASSPGYLRAAVIPSAASGEAILHTSRSLLVGDAGGLVDPFSGEGIYYALRSGRLAARAVVSFLEGKGDLGSYSESVQKELLSPLYHAGRIAKVVYSLTPVIHRLVRANPEVARRLVEVLLGSRTYPELWLYLKARYRIFR
ncbi:MAG: geranylgeranyl reductase family protein [Thermoanaerobacteraceae bacterium]|nr:geranylgeranyl reductase family protein [Thermoanaerobacteraceae bacterium]